MENLLSCVENEFAAISYFHEAYARMLEDNFILHQWCTNSPTLQKEVQDNNTSIQSSTVSSLRLSWDSQTDMISFPLQDLDSTNTQLTKRKVLSTTSKLYNPLGMLSPVTLVTHLFAAKLWERKLGWDQPLPPSLH